MMGFFGFLQRPDLGQGLERFAATPNALLLDVRTQEEYADGHIPESRNLPLQTLGRTELLPPPGRRPSSSTVSAASGAVRRPACCGAWGILM
ncbi:rhodanese-like domain-containing protein [Dysosmobacter welbionis]